MPSNHLILYRPLLLLPPIFPSIRVFSNESADPVVEGSKGIMWIQFPFSLSPVKGGTLKSQTELGANLATHFLRSESESCSVVSNSLQPHGHVVHGILQVRILQWVAFPFSRGSSQPRDQTQVSHIAGGFLTSWATKESSWNLITINSDYDIVSRYYLAESL